MRRNGVGFVFGRFFFWQKIYVLERKKELLSKIEETSISVANTMARYASIIIDKKDVPCGEGEEKPADHFCWHIRKGGGGFGSLTRGRRKACRSFLLAY